MFDDIFSSFSPRVVLKATFQASQSGPADSQRSWRCQRANANPAGRTGGSGCQRHDLMNVGASLTL